MKLEGIKVLDKGYLRVTHLGGDDLTVVNAARVSYDNESEWWNEHTTADVLADRDTSLLRYLATHGHTSPFRHATIGLEVYAPLMVARQWWKHVVGAPFVDTPWNESSRRYTTEQPEMYLPEVIFEKPAKSKQGSGGPHPNSESWRLSLDRWQKDGVAIYEDAVASGVAVEQARLFLAAYGLYVRWRWVPSLQAAHHFVELRDHEGAQSEITEYAKALDIIMLQHFPEAWGALRRRAPV